MESKSKKIRNFMEYKSKINLKQITYEYLDSLKYVKEIKRHVELGKSSDIFCVVGPRRVGKTFLMLKKAKKLINMKKQVVYVSFDEPLLSKIDVREFAELVRKEFPENKVYLFLDEIQEWDNWDFNLRWLHDVKDFYIYVSGSSSTLLSSEIPSRLRGRYISKVIFPLSFRELTNFEVKTFREKGKIMHYLEEYLKWGGFPEIWKLKTREKIISILDTSFYRDILERSKIGSFEEFKEFFYFILSKYSNRFTYNSLRKLLKNQGINLDTKTIIKYIKAIENAFLIFVLNRFSYSEREKIISYKKIYLIDLSFTYLFDQGLDLGRKIENLVFLELLRNSFDIFYYTTKDNKEIDFYIPSRKILIETSVNYDEEHIEKLFAAMEELGLNKSFLVTWDCEARIKKDKKIIIILPLWKFLLNKLWNQNPKK